MQSQSPYLFLDHKSVSVLSRLADEASKFLETSGSRDIYIIQVEIGTRRVTAMSCIVFILFKSKRGIRAAAHRSPPKLIRDITSWQLVAKGQEWREPFLDRIDDTVSTFSQRSKTDREDIVLSIEIGKKATVREIIEEGKAVFLRF